MSLRTILKFPDPILRQKAKKITTFDDSLQDLTNDMLETMYDAPGIGLAAPQIGESIQVIVVNASQEEDGKDSELFWAFQETIYPMHLADSEANKGISEWKFQIHSLFLLSPLLHIQNNQ